ncbi:MAG: hypothetical protein PQJ61_12480 [Spirochaetales bacterium]|uniref:Uncharacterized protein n=1 Tax=Candidatus Thalassospirochaeta sargassi TaxID=3119039 RepID=A0AAJ1IGM7_9SPIO|nr:hypothetical protein [Spirochaetales bacterium]
MDKSLEARRVFTAANKRMLEALQSAAEEGNTALLEQINIVMPVSAYERLIDSGLYESVRRKGNDRRSVERRSNDRRKSGKR